MSDGLFYLSGGDLHEMRVAAYDAEEVLQGLLASHPDLLAGGQMTPIDPRRWLLIRREHGVPDRQESTGRWSVDHLFVDQDAVPTLVEVKRSTDTRIRREVVGQMLDYAANGVRFWPAATLQAAFEATQHDIGSDPVTAIAELRRSTTTSVEAFFDEVETNLRAGRIRLIFVADKIPTELRTIVEFLNEQMSQAEVLAVEVKQYRADGRDDIVVVPTLYGRSAVTPDKPGQRSRRSHEESLAAASADTHELLNRIQELADVIDLTTTRAPASLVLKTHARESLATVYLLWNSLEIQIQPLRERGWVDQAESYLAELRACTQKQLPTKHPDVPVSDVLAHWEQIRGLLIGMAELYKRDR